MSSPLCNLAKDFLCIQNNRRNSDSSCQSAGRKHHKRRSCSSSSTSKECKKKQEFIKFQSAVFPGSASNGNVPIAYITAGKKSNPAILLIHGNGATKEGWIGVMKVLACKGYFVIAPDRRGTGGSGKPSTSAAEYNITLIALDHQLVLQALGVSHPTVVGHSFGARFAVQYYFQFLNDPTFSASRLVLIAPATAGFPTGAGGLAFRAGLLAGDLNAIAGAFRDFAVTPLICGGCTKVSAKKLEQLRQITFNAALQTTLFAYQQVALINPGPGGNPQFQGNFAPQGTVLPSLIVLPGLPGTVNITTANNPNYSNIAIPTLVITSDQDSFVPPSAAFLATALIPGAFAYEIRGAPHFTPTTNFCVVSQQIIKFIKYIADPCSISSATKIPKGCVKCTNCCEINTK